MSRRQLPRTTAAILDAATFLPGEIAVDTTNDELRYDGDGSTVGGIKVARKDGVGTSVTATGSTTARTLADRFAEVWSAEDFGTITAGSNSAADTNATTINAAITAAASAVSSSGAPYAIVRLPARVVVWAGAITLKTGVLLDLNGSTLKAKNSLNANFIEGENTASLYAGSTAGGIYDAGVINGTIDGNKANQTSGHTLRVYGYKLRFESLHITNAKERAFSTKWGNPGLLATPPARGLENIVRKLYIDFAGQEGIYHEGPNDSHYSDVFVVSCGQDTTNTYDNVVATGTYGHAHWTRLHSWRWSPEASGGYVGFVYPRYALRVESEGNEFDSCDLEGGYTGNVLLTGGYNAFNATCAYYGVRTGGSNIVIRSSFNTIHGRLSSPESGACKGIVLGLGSDTVTHNMIDVILSEQQNGLVDWTNSDGYNTVKARGYNTSGTFQVGTRNANDVADIVISGSGGGTLQESGLGYKYSVGYLKRSLTTGITAAGTVQGDATALSADNDVHYVGTVASGTGVLLPNAGAQGEITVINDGANALKVYPPSGHTIQGSSINAAKTLPAGRARTFIQITSTYWITKSVSIDAADYYAPGGTDVAVADGGTGDSGTAWTSYTPTLTYPTTAPTTAVVSARYKTLGKTMWVSIDFNVTSLGAGAGNVRFSLPSGTVAVLTPLAGYNNDAGTVQAAFAHASLNCFVLVPSPAMAAQHYYIGGVLELT